MGFCMYSVSVYRRLGECVIVSLTVNGEYHPGGHQWNYYSSALFLTKITAAHFQIGYPSMKSTGTPSSNESQWLDWTSGYQSRRSSNGRQGDMPYCVELITGKVTEGLVQKRNESDVLAVDLYFFGTNLVSKKVITCIMLVEFEQCQALLVKTCWRNILKNLYDLRFYQHGIQVENWTRMKLMLAALVPFCPSSRLLCDVDTCMGCKTVLVRKEA